MADNNFTELENKLKALDDLMSLHIHDGGTSQKITSEATVSGWVTRGDVSDTNSLTFDGNWNELDLSAKIPADTKWVKAKVSMIAVGTNLDVRFRPSGYTLNSTVYNPKTSSSIIIDLEVIGGKTTYNANTSFSSVQFLVIAYQL